MLLTIDIGNTNVKVALWDNGAWLPMIRLRTQRSKTADEYGNQFKGLMEANNVGEINQIVICSVVPQLTGAIYGACKRYLHVTPTIVTHETDTGISLNVDDPTSVGPDLIVDGVGGYVMYGGPCIVIDMGTATTVQAMSADGALEGVAIVPGLKTSVDALTSRAAMLGNIPLEAPPSPLGRNTRHAMQSGVIYGYADLVNGLTQRFMNEPGYANATVIGTGGLMSLVAPYAPLVEHVAPMLTLDGLRIIADRVG